MPYEFECDDPDCGCHEEFDMERARLLLGVDKKNHFASPVENTDIKRKPGRPKSPPRPKPVSWRPMTQAERDKYLSLGGARWLRRVLEEA